MAVTASTPRLLRKRVPAFVAALAVLFSVSSVTAAAAQAAETKGEGRPSTAGAEARAWIPQVIPISSPERVWRDVNGTERRNLLWNCPSGWACVAAGEGDGQHTVYWLYYCSQRSLTNFIDAGAVVNNQTGGATVRLKRQDGSVKEEIAARSGVIVGVDWRPIWYIDPC
ncbi:hypothetical protein [Actinomadura sp. 6K520]|jgi:hypothetical protein|uniref:hypothetical protein n=1 Tax=Actinomadura sp. 6K520 TaxID=2530364 RepID=UPI00104B081B|nr:hypothetical protein [Actinomadura sp. 6K520]TDE33218.1 hypothetical protein E1289_13220 [Actinomadura sp. 6K520]